MSCANKACTSLAIARPPASKDLDWPWPNWFHDLFPAMSRMWQKRRERHALLELDDRLLDDIGVTRDMAERQGYKWFWQ